MNIARWQEISEVFSHARDLGATERETFLSELEATDRELAIEVRRLLSSHARASDFLEPPSETQIEAPLRRLSLDFRGLQLGDFEIKKEIGRGAAGVVYLGLQRSLRRKVAIKLLAPQLTGTSINRERFEREAQAASRLRHPAIVTVLAYGEQNGAHYLVMEHVDGQSLHEHLEALRAARERGALPTQADVSSPLRAAGIVLQLAEALEYCHRQGVLHRDIKPHNVLLDHELAPRIVDFGLAKDLTRDGMTDAGQMSGTLHYMSPEQAQARSSELDARTDVYSLGVVLHELLTLRRPFEHVGASDLLHQLTHADPQPYEMLEQGLPNDLVAVCMKALARRAEERYASAGEMAADLRRWLDGARVKARRTSALRRSWRTVVRNRYKIAAGALLVGFAILVVEMPRGNPPVVSAQLEVELPRDRDGNLTLPSRFDKMTIREVHETVDGFMPSLPEQARIMWREALNNYLATRLMREFDDK